MTKISIIIPTYKARPYVDEQIAVLRGQTLPPHEIIIIDSSSPDGTAERARELGVTVIEIAQADFNHGGTRNQAATRANGDILVFMTQDAIPLHADYLEALTAGIRADNVAAAYARQEADARSSPLEQFARSFNYPPTQHIKTLDDIDTLGIKTFFYSDTASAVRADVFQDVEGYPDWVIVNEDMVLAAKLLQAGHAIQYAADARVLHAHDYTMTALFRRYFDIGVFMKQAASFFAGAKSGGEGLRFAMQQLGYLRKRGMWRWMVRSVLETGIKWVAFQLGKRSAMLPLRLRRYFSGQKAYWG